LQAQIRAAGRSKENKDMLKISIGRKPLKANNKPIRMKRSPHGTVVRVLLPKRILFIMRFVHNAPSVLSPAAVPRVCHPSAHAFSCCTCSPSWGVKSFAMPNMARISSEVRPLIILATVLQVTSKRGAMSNKLAAYRKKHQKWKVGVGGIVSGYECK